MKKNNDSNLKNNILNNSDKTINNILKNENINGYIINRHLLILFCTLIYGMITGFFVGGAQIFINAIKISIILFSLIYISLPVFYVFDYITNSKIKFKSYAM